MRSLESIIHPVTSKHSRIWWSEVVCNLRPVGFSHWDGSGLQKYVILQNISYRIVQQNLYLSCITLCLVEMLTSCCLYRLLPWWFQCLSTRILATRHDVSHSRWDNSIVIGGENLSVSSFLCIKFFFFFFDSKQTDNLKSACFNSM